ncbi:hypothetical protein GCM10011490_04300 [Pseudoclavibacter endophyticus]|uniref:DUF3618 domain-containing protein n=1 Tax=Pseudoclavibacter endophyticus TaxID=1778590 RepID=A0A6H9WTP0_9MICO|nr:hypothetical protein [Pseudoclavibacter endophyticus]KAB1650055.1 hypothetical protein F8O04_07565 [Pseudoclavibacter endophyticus]GGA57627.1 hypothetical protein GCM10011490_04300 [Pseudoclavibacter endophyticus]
MTQQSDSTARDGAHGHTPDGSTSGRKSHAVNQRVDQLRGGLEKAVVGRETAIKVKAVEWAEQLDERWQGRHHNKLFVALKAIEFVVDHARRSPGDTAAGHEAPDAEHLGEFRNVSDDGRASRPA